MTVLALLIPVSLGLGLAGLAAFVWTLRAGQYDDLDGAAARILIDAPQPGGADPENAAPAARNSGAEAQAEAVEPTRETAPGG